jgi:hypothetical protein
MICVNNSLPGTIPAGNSAFVPRRMPRKIEEQIDIDRECWYNDTLKNMSAGSCGTTGERI